MNQSKRRSCLCPCEYVTEHSANLAIPRRPVDFARTVLVLVQ